MDGLVPACAAVAIALVGTRQTLRRGEGPDIHVLIN
jgi:hypothetical protein